MIYIIPTIRVYTTSGVINMIIVNLNYDRQHTPCLSRSIRYGL